MCTKQSLSTLEKLSTYHFRQVITLSLKSKMAAGGHFVSEVKPTEPFYGLPYTFHIQKNTKVGRNLLKILAKNIMFTELLLLTLSLFERCDPFELMKNREEL